MMMVVMMVVMVVMVIIGALVIIVVGLNRSAVKRRLGSTKYVVMRSCGQRG